MPSPAPHDFLLEASERTSRALFFDTRNGSWLEEEAHPSHVVRPIRVRRRGGLDGALLTRTYSGRPHIPGEDSGSEMEDDRTTNPHQSRPNPSGRTMADTLHSDTDRARSLVYDTTLPDSPTQPASAPPGNLQGQSNNGQTSYRSLSRQSLQNSNSDHVRRTDSIPITSTTSDHSEPASGLSYAINRSGTPIRARRAPPRPQSMYSMEETINRAAVFERRLERALQEYRSARRTWATLSNPHTNMLNNETHTRTATSTSETAQATATFAENGRTEHNSIQDILRSARREQSAMENSTMQNNHAERGIGRSPRYRDTPSSGQYDDIPWWRQEPEYRSLYRATGPNDLSSTSTSLSYDRRLRSHQSNQALSFTSTQPPISSYSRSSYRNHGGGQSDRLQHLAERISYGSSLPLTSGPFMDSLRDSRPGNDYISTHRRTIPVPAYTLSGTETRLLSQRREVENARSARNRSDHRMIQKPKAILKFLARLRNDLLTREQAWDLATSLEIHNQSLEQDSQTDIVMSIDETPQVEYTSWVEPGMTWTGHQYADHTDGHSLAPTVISDELAVKVVLHSVDWEKMTLTGTMVANQSQRKKNTESFFTGEIIDFRTHGLDTYYTARPRRYTSFNTNHNDLNQSIPDGTYQDLEMDLLHWPMLGPFKREVDRALGICRTENRQHKSHCSSDRDQYTSLTTDTVGDTGGHINSNDDPHSKTSRHSERSSPPYTGLTADDVASIRLSRMNGLLSSAKWLRSNLNQAGWILMRWKEQCFMPSTATSQSSGTEILSQDIGSDNTRPRSQQVWTTVQSERESLNSTPNESETTTGNNTWGLSIDGFYYVAMNRQTGEIEALYHDPGSVLYQRLEMKPSPAPPGDLGVRTSFSLVEFR